MKTRILAFVALTASCLLAVAACATLTDSDALIERHAGQAVSFKVHERQGVLLHSKTANAGKVAH
jgi:hypothetical protein